MINIIPWALAAASALYLLRGWYLNRRDYRRQKAETKRILMELRRHNQQGAE